MKKIIIIIVIIAILAGGYLLYKNANQKNPPRQTPGQSLGGNLNDFKFLGQKGDNLVLENGAVKIDALVFNDSQAHFYNVQIPLSKTVYFFIVKDKNGIYRAAANACQVCYGVRKGFHQEGEEIVCNNCGNRYPIEKIATEKGGCNPAPINPNLKVSNGQITISQTELEQVLNLF